jgi:hypothetical protein
MVGMMVDVDVIAVVGMGTSVGIETTASGWQRVAAAILEESEMEMGC